MSDWVTLLVWAVFAVNSFVHWRGYHAVCRRNREVEARLDVVREGRMKALEDAGRLAKALEDIRKEHVRLASEHAGMVQVMRDVQQFCDDNDIDLTLRWGPRVPHGNA